MAEISLLVRVASLFATAAYLWLGLTVLLNSERRVAGVWLGGAGLLVAGLFFAGHSALVGMDARLLVEWIASGALEPLWRIAWTLFVVPPFLWRLVVAWYAGQWQSPRARDVALAVSLGLVGAALLAAIPALPGSTSVLAGVPRDWNAVLPLAYPAYALVCVALSLTSIGRSTDGGEPLVDVARALADRWLRATTLLLVGVGLLIGVAVGALLGPLPRPPSPLAPPTLTVLLALDALLAGLLGVVVVLLGRAVVSYEVFTGKALPRGDLYRQWRNGLLFAAAGALVLGSAVTHTAGATLAAVAGLLLALFLALQSWRTLVDRDRGVAMLRPFVASQRLLEGMIETANGKVNTATPFHALVRDVLGAEVGYLVAVGHVASLVSAPLVYPVNRQPPPAIPSDLLAELAVPGAVGVPVVPDRHGGAIWAVPLSGERGPVGVLLLGPKAGGSLYVQEELEIARSAGERLLDARAGAELGRRLVALQRERLTTSLLLDQRARRVLHDDVLPRLHAALLELSAEGASARAVDSLAAVHRELSCLLRELPAGRSPELEKHGLIGALRRTAEVEHARQFDCATCRVEAGAEVLAGALPGLTAEVAFGAAREAIRNSARHGRGGDPSRRLRLTVEVSAREGLQIVVSDDGVGMVAGQDSAEGTGQGLTLHGTLLALVGGTLAVETPPEGGTRVTIALPSRP